MVKGGNLLAGRVEVIWAVGNSSQGSCAAEEEDKGEGKGKRRHNGTNCFLSSLQLLICHHRLDL